MKCHSHLLVGAAGQWPMSLNCHCAPKDAHLSFVEQRDGERLGYNCSCLPCLADLTLIRITLREHDRWESSYIHTETHMCTDVGPHTHMFKQRMNKWILRWFFVLYLRGKKKAGEPAERVSSPCRATLLWTDRECGEGSLISLPQGKLFS